MTTAPHPIVTLMDGREVDSWSAEWRDETYLRELEMLAIFRLPDREARRAHLARYEQRIAAAATKAGHADPAAVGAEARRRLEERVMERWRSQQAAAAAGGAA